MFYVYILASQKNGTLYVGVTNNLIKRVWEHKKDIVKRSFTSRYQVHTLVYHEQSEDVISAISREKQIKDWRRSWKVRLIERSNPDWIDLYNDLL